MTIALHPYQEAAIIAFDEGLAIGHTRQVAYLPCGCGKTVLGMELGRRKGRTLWLAHRKELIDQPVETAKVIWPDAEVGVVKAERDEWAAKDLVVATVQSIAQPKRLDRHWGRSRSRAEPWDLIVVDEVHHAGSRKPKKQKRDNAYRRVLEKWPAVPTIGLTATPRNPAKAGFTAFAYRMSIREAIRFGYLVPFVYERAVAKELDLSKVPTKDGDYDREKLAEALKNAHAAEETAKAFAEKAGGRKGVIFTVRVDQARRTAEVLQGLGVAAGWVSGETPADERTRTLRDLRSGRLRAVANCSVLNEGYDDPSIDCAVMARPTRSKQLYIQCMGRALRRFPGKKNALLLDLVDAHATAGLRIAPRLLERPSEAEEKEETGDLQVLARFGMEKRPDTAVDGFLDAAEEGKPLSVEMSRVAWIEAGPNLFALPVGDGNLVLRERVGGDWVAERLNGRRKPELVAGPSVDPTLVQGVAEALAEKEGALELSLKVALWRTRPASQDQYALLGRLRTVFAADLTQGEASDLIAAAIVRERYSQALRAVTR